MHDLQILQAKYTLKMGLFIEYVKFQNPTQIYHYSYPLKYLYRMYFNNQIIILTQFDNNIALIAQICITIHGLKKVEINTEVSMFRVACHHLSGK